MAFLQITNRILWGGNNGKVYLTFDDGPDKNITPKILDLLGELEIKATFFLIGQKAERNRGLIQQMQREGHAIGNHSYSHPKMWWKSKGELKFELLKTDEILSEITGEKPTLFRPPYGKFGLSLLSLIKTTNHKIVLWNHSLRDYKKNVTAQKIQTRLENIRPGQIILSHDGHKRSAHTLEALTNSLRSLKQNGIQFAPLAN